MSVLFHWSTVPLHCPTSTACLYCSHNNIQPYLSVIKALHCNNDSENVCLYKQHCFRYSVATVVLITFCVNRIQVWKYSFTLTSSPRTFSLTEYSGSVQDKERCLLLIFAQVSPRDWLVFCERMRDLNDLIISQCDSVIMSLCHSGAVFPRTCLLNDIKRPVAVCQTILLKFIWRTGLHLRWRIARGQLCFKS